MSSELSIVEAPRGLVAHWQRLAQRSGLPIRVMRVHAPPTSAQVAEEAHDKSVVPLLLRQETAAQVLDVSESSFRRLVKAGDMPVVRVNGSTRVRVDDLRAYVERLGQSTGPESGVNATVPASVAAPARPKVARGSSSVRPEDPPAPAGPPIDDQENP